MSMYSFVMEIIAGHNAIKVSVVLYTRPEVQLQLSMQHLCMTVSIPTLRIQKYSFMQGSNLLTDSQCSKRLMPVFGTSSLSWTAHHLSWSSASNLCRPTSCFTNSCHSLAFAVSNQWAGLSVGALNNLTENSEKLCVCLHFEWQNLYKCVCVYSVRGVLCTRMFYHLGGEGLTWTVDMSKSGLGQSAGSC